MTLPRNQFLLGDAVARLAALPDVSVDMVLTSPPYFRLRDYQVAEQLGAEGTVDDWVDGLSAVAAEIARVLTPTGTLWINLGDSYATRPREGAARKSLVLGPERLALRLTEQGWTLRNKIVWHKSNHMPTSVRDRLASSWEPLYVFARQPQYFFDLDAIRVPHTSAPPRIRPIDVRATDWRGPNAGTDGGLARLKAAGIVGHPFGKNPGDVWTIASSNYRGSHRATFPAALAERAIQAGCPEAICPECRAPWQRRLIRTGSGTSKRTALGPTCSCQAGHEPGLVLDPFMGSGTTALAAEGLRRDWLGIDLNPDFVREATERLQRAQAAS